MDERTLLGSRLHRSVCLGAIAIAVVVGSPATSPALAQSDVSGIYTEELKAGGDINMIYLLHRFGWRPQEPKGGFGLVVVLPGGDGSEEFAPFVQRIHKNALSREYLVAQLVAVKWGPGQKIVWPTRRNKVDDQQFSTEKFVETVIEEIQGEYKIDKRRIFTLSWSSGGPAAYAVSLQKKTAVTGSYIVMSVFKPKDLPGLKRAKGRAYFIEHSPEDETCPYDMARQARDALREHGAKVKLFKYFGGHDWKGNVHKRLRRGFAWLENPKTKKSSKKSRAKTLLRDGFEDGDKCPAGWEQGANVPGVEYVWDKEEGYKSDASLCLNKTAQKFWPIAQWQRTVAHKGAASELKITARIKAEKATKAVIDVQFLDKDGRLILHEWAVYIGAKRTGAPPANHGWKKYTGNVDIQDETKQVRIALQIYGPGRVWFDALKVEYVDSD